MSKPYGVRVRIRSISAALKTRWGNLPLPFGAGWGKHEESPGAGQVRAEESLSQSSNALRVATFLP